MSSSNIIAIRREEAQVYSLLKALRLKNDLYAQYKIDRAVLDFAIPDLKIGIEVGADFPRKELKSQGWNIIHIASNELEDMKAVARKLLTVLI